MRKSQCPAKWLLLAFLFSAAGSHPLFPAEKQAGEASYGEDPVSAATGRIERMVSTLNEALEENKRLRDEARGYKVAVEDTKTQNNLLMSQIRLLQAQAEEAKRENEKQIAEIRKQIDEAQKEKAKAEEEKRIIEEARAEAERKKEKSEAKNLELKNLLDRSALKGEEAPYRALLKDAARSQKKFVNDFSQMTRENIKLKKELSEKYYSLGNFLFESAQYKRAVREYEKAIRNNPRDSWAHHNLGVIFDFYLNKPKRAVYHYRKYLNLKPIEEEGRGIRERILELELGKVMVPKAPLLSEFNHYQEKLKVKT